MKARTLLRGPPPVSPSVPHGDCPLHPLPPPFGQGFPVGTQSPTSTPLPPGDVRFRSKSCPTSFPLPSWTLSFRAPLALPISGDPFAPPGDPSFRSSSPFSYSPPCRPAPLPSTSSSLDGLSTDPRSGPPGSAWACQVLRRPPPFVPLRAPHPLSPAYASKSW